jgi:hypothetical protein
LAAKRRKKAQNKSGTQEIRKRWPQETQKAQEESGKQNFSTTDFTDSHGWKAGDKPVGLDINVAREAK